MSPGDSVPMVPGSSKRGGFPVELIFQVYKCTLCYTRDRKGGFLEWWNLAFMLETFLYSADSEGLRV